MKPPTVTTHPPSVDVPEDNRPLVAPIYQSAKFTFDELEEVERKLAGERDGFWYSRQSNPTLKQLELTLAALQGSEACLLTASGAAAVNLAMLCLCKQGDHVVCFAEMYGPTRYMAQRTLARFGVQHTLLSIEDLDGLERTLAARPTRLVTFESPTNPVLKIADIARLTDIAKRHGALAVMDNTLAGFHNHGQFAVDLFVHSLTKFASGHGDVMGGAILGKAALLDSIRGELGILGATLDPHAAFLIQRGLKTYFLRYERQCANALGVAQYLERHPRVARVAYPGLESHPQRQLALAQLRDFGAVVAFDLAASPPECRTFANALKLFHISASLGSAESLILPPSLLQPRGLTGPQREWARIGPGTVRLAVGIEDLGDLLADLEQALGALP